MIRIIGVIAATALVSTGGGLRQHHSGDHPAGSSADAGATESSAPFDVGALLAAARGAPPEICSLAARAIRDGNWGGSSDAPVTPLGRAPDVNMRREIRDLPAPQVGQLLAALASPDGCVREISARLIGEQQDSIVAPPLIERLGSSDASLRTTAAFALGIVGAPRAVDPLVRALRDAVPDVRANSAWALGRIGEGRALAPLVATMGDKSSTVREASVIAVGRMDSTSSEAALVRVLKQDDVASVRRAAAWALGTLGVSRNNAASPALAAALTNDSDTSVREMSAWALGNGDGAAPTSALERALKDRDEAVREQAAWALGQSDDASAADALADALQSDHSARVRGTAAWAIGQLSRSDRRASAALTHALNDSDDHVRLKAAWALGQIEDSTAVPDISNALGRERNSEVQRALLRALTKSGGDSPARLRGLIDSKDPKLREAAVRSLAGGRSFSPWPWPMPRPRPWP